jgi:tight adherence protein C
MDWSSILIPAATFAFVSAILATSALLIVRGDQRVKVRLSALADERGQEVAVESKSLSSAPGSLLAWLNRVLIPSDRTQQKRGRDRLIQAGFYARSSLTVFLVAKFASTLLAVLAGVLLFLLGIVPLHVALLGACAAGIAGFFGPDFWLRQHAVRRQHHLERSLSDYLDLMVACLESGMSLQRAIQRVSDELEIVHPVLAYEMQIVQREIELGARPEEALRHFGMRANLETVRTLATFVEQSRKLGTTMADAMRVQAESLRIHRAQRTEEMAQKASVKILLPMLLFIFPATFVVVAGPAAIQINERLTQNGREPEKTVSPQE